MLQRTYRGAIALAAITAVSSARAGDVAFHVAFDTSADVLTPAERANVASHLAEAGRRWVALIATGGPSSIELRVSVADIPTANGASAATAFVGVVDGRDTYEQGVAYELETGIDPNGGDADANVTFGLAYLRNELWFDPDPAERTAPVPANRTDAMSVALHELGHVLAYNGWADLDTGEPPAGYWSVFDSWMIPGTPTRFSGPAADAAWGSQPDLTIGNIMHWGNAMLESPSARIACRERPASASGAPAPRLCDAPPSQDRPRDLAAGASLIDQLMNGVVFYRGWRYDISALDEGVLADVGLRSDSIFAAGFDLL